MYGQRVAVLPAYRKPSNRNHVEGIMLDQHHNVGRRIAYAALVSLVCLALPSVVFSQGQPAKIPAHRQPPPIGAEVSTDQVKMILQSKSEPVVDVRSPQEYSIAHIPGSINLFETELEAMAKLMPEKISGMVIYCNGPYCHKVKRVAEDLFKKGYTNVKRYQLGLPVWRAEGNTVQTDLEGFKYIFSGDKTAVFVDARDRADFEKESVPKAVSIRAGEVDKANVDGRLPYTDKGTRVIVFADRPDAAMKVAAEIARKAFWNSSYFGETFEDMKKAKLW
jgi:rhodanese-related sulfurtransferase